MKKCLIGLFIISLLMSACGGTEKSTAAASATATPIPPTATPIPPTDTPTPPPTVTTAPSPTPPPTATPFPNQAPSISEIEEQIALAGGSFAPLALDDYVSDPDHAGSEITWRYSGNVELDLNIADRVATTTIPDPAWRGSETVRFEACDPGGLCDAQEVVFSLLDESEVEITYINNEGFLLASHSKKILIDSLFQGVGATHFTPTTLTSLKYARQPFDDVDLVLATHSHADHFDAMLVGIHLENNPEAIFVSTQDTVDRLQASFPGFDQIQDRVIGVELDRGASTQMTVNGVKLEILNVPHDHTPNLGFLIHLGGFKLLHLGDPNVDLESLSVFQAHQLPSKEIDVAFAPYFFFTDESLHSVVLEGLQAEHLVPMHYSPVGADIIAKEIEPHFPQAIMFEQSMQAQVVQSSPAESETPSPTSPQTLEDTWTRPSDGAVMVYVPAGTFPMGSTEDEVDAALALCRQHYNICNRSFYMRESPQHSVTLDSFWLDQTEVTNAQYRLCVDAGECRAPTTCDNGEPTFRDSAKADHPVLCVNWDEAQAYCQWAGARLPTEAEWEYASRGPQGLIYPWGDTLDGTRLNFCDANCDLPSAYEAVDDGHAGTAPVGSYPEGASWCGALDMSGNVFEWVADWIGPYPAEAQTNPTGPETGREKVLRGGSWNYHPARVRGAARDKVRPDKSFDFLGFRCAVSPGE